MRHRRIACFALVCATLNMVPTARAQSLESEQESLGTCLVDHSTGQDRKELVRWMFAALSVHPAVADLSAATAAAREQENKAFGALTTRLLTVDCRQEAKAAYQNGNFQVVFEKAFARLGQAAMRELMSDPNVETEFSSLANYMDRDQFSAALSGK